MEKLIELLNEYEAKRHKTSVIANIRKGEDRLSYLEMNWNYSELLCISKGYEFIKRLIEKDKIDRHSEKLELDMKRMRIPQDYYISWVQSLDLQHKKAQYLSLIALLSIQDNPIEFLCEILK